MSYGLVGVRSGTGLQRWQTKTHEAAIQSHSWRPATTEPPNEFTIIISDHVFVLTQDQIHRDAPNYFTMFFEGSFKESREGVRELKLYRDPYLFTFIHMYLSGYEILPLPRGNELWHLSEDSRLTNLLLVPDFMALTRSRGNWKQRLILRKIRMAVIGAAPRARCGNYSK